MRKKEQKQRDTQNTSSSLYTTVAQINNKNVDSNRMLSSPQFTIHDTVSPV